MATINEVAQIVGDEVAEKLNNGLQGEPLFISGKAIIKTALTAIVGANNTQTITNCFHGEIIYPRVKKNNEKIFSLYQQGVKIPLIAKEVDLSRGHIYREIKKNYAKWNKENKENKNI